MYISFSTEHFLLVSFLFSTLLAPVLFDDYDNDNSDANDDSDNDDQKDHC